MTSAIAGYAQLKQEGRNLDCEVLQIELRPGIGRSEMDRVELWIDRSTHLMHRVRMSLNGLESTRGALVDIDTFAHRGVFGIQWPTQFHERLLRPVPLDVHAWRLTGLDINRGESEEELEGPVFRELPANITLIEALRLSKFARSEWASSECSGRARTCASASTRSMRWRDGMYVRWGGRAAQISQLAHADVAEFGGSSRGDHQGSASATNPWPLKLLSTQYPVN
jgi:hypothetical protein